MEWYIGAFGFLWSVVLLYRVAGRRDSLLVTVAMFVTSGLLCGLRADIGTDTFVYRTFYDSVVAGQETFPYEPGFYWMADCGRALGLGSQFLILVVALLQCVAMCACAQRASERDLFCLLMLSTFQIMLGMNLIRCGLAVYLAALAFSMILSSHRFAGSVLSIGAVLSHITAVGVLPFVIRSKTIAVLICIGGVSATWVLDRVDYLVPTIQMEFEPEKIGIGLMVNVALLSVVCHLERRWRDGSVAYTFALYVGASIAALFLVQAERFALLFLALLFVAMTKRPILTRGARIALIAFAALGVYRSLMFVSRSDSAMSDLMAREPGFAQLYGPTLWIPYRFFWQ